jgi:hypothetical protein
VFITLPTLTEKTGYFLNSTKKTKELIELLKTNISSELANSHLPKYTVIDISDIVIDSKDGVHYTETDHEIVANRVFNPFKIY